MEQSIKELINIKNILNSMNDGVYVTDIDRKIVYWNKAAEKITGWSMQDVIGSSCMDDILCHKDKENRRLCGVETCPLLRSMITGNPSSKPIIVYTKTREGKKLSVQVNVAPIQNDLGKIIGGVEVFRDITYTMDDLTRAKKIQRKSLKWKISKDAKLKASVHYTPHDTIGGDYYAVQQLTSNQYAFLLADVMGHGTSAALYTMYLRSLFDEYFDLLPDVANFFNTLNNQLYQLMRANFSFAAAVCGVIDTQKQTLKIVGGAFSNLLLYNTKNTQVQQINIPGYALGMVKNADYSVQTFNFSPGNLLFMFTDGAIENPDKNGEELGEKGLISILQELSYPQNNSQHQQVEKQIIKHSASVDLKDDLTFLEFHWPININ